jgi:hypothetical protein
VESADFQKQIATKKTAPGGATQPSHNFHRTPKGCPAFAVMAEFPFPLMVNGGDLGRASAFLERHDLNTPTLASRLW